MKLFVLGGTGRIGSAATALAVARGHAVTMLVRSPQKARAAPGVTIVGGNPLDRHALAATLPGHDAVLSSIGPPGRDGLRPCTLMTDSASSTIEAMAESGVSRLAIVSAAVLFPGDGLYFAFFQWLLRHHARDLRAMEQLVSNSGLAWTIARPPRLTTAPEVRFRSLAGALPAGGRSVSVRSVATFMLDAIERRSHVREVVGVAR